MKTSAGQLVGRLQTETEKLKGCEGSAGARFTAHSIRGGGVDGHGGGRGEGSGGGETLSAAQSLRQAAAQYGEQRWSRKPGPFRADDWPVVVAVCLSFNDDDDIPREGWPTVSI